MIDPWLDLLCLLAEVEEDEEVPEDPDRERDWQIADEMGVY